MKLSLFAAASASASTNQVGLLDRLRCAFRRQRPAVDQPAIARRMGFIMRGEALRSRDATVTRRLGWRHLRVGDVLCAMQA